MDKEPISLQMVRSYVGQWFQDQQHGQGVYYFANGNRYDGLWYKDYQQGQGTMYYYNGDKYIGNWDHDKRSGEGKYIFCQWSVL